MLSLLKRENMKKNTIAKGKDIEVFIEGDRCYKVFNEKFPKRHIMNEAFNLATVEELEINTPRLLEITMVDGKWALVEDYIEGKSLAELMDENPEREDYYLEQFVDIQRSIQKQRSHSLSKHNDKMNRKISMTDLSATLRYDLHERIESKPKHNFLCHGDYNPTNVILNGDKYYVIDWSHATLGNIEADAGRTYMMFLIDQKKKRARKYIDLFCLKAGLDVDDILCWLPILAASQSVKDIKDQAEFLKSIIFMSKKELQELYEQE